MIKIPYQKTCGIHLSLKVALEAHIIIPGNEELVINRAMYLMTDSTTIPQGLMFEDKWPPLFRMTFETYLINIQL